MRRSNKTHAQTSSTKNDNNAKTEGAGLRHVARLHGAGQTAAEAERQPRGESQERSSHLEPHPDLFSAADQQQQDLRGDQLNQQQQELSGDQLNQQPLGHQLQRDFLRLLSLLQAERRVSTGVPVTPAEIRRREGVLPNPLELHLSYLCSHRRPSSHTSLLPSGGAGRGGEDAACSRLQLLGHCAWKTEEKTVKKTCFDPCVHVYTDCCMVSK